jgi:hypothetical protein
MSRYSDATLLVAAIVITCTFGVTAQRVRTLRPSDQPIGSRLLPDDQVVVIESIMGPSEPSPFKLTRETELRDLARWEEVAIIHQARPQSFFVKNGIWLSTRVQARVMQTLKTDRLATAPGKVIEFEHEGGELTVKGVIIRSAVGVSFDENTRYLVGVRFHPDLKKWQVGVMFELDNLGNLREHTRRDGSTPDSALKGARLADIAEAISKAAK